MLGQIGAKTLKLHGQIGAGALAHCIVLSLQVLPDLVCIALIGDGGFGIGLKLLLLGFQFLHSRCRCSLMGQKTMRTCGGVQAQVVGQLQVLRQMVLLATQFLACQLNILFEGGNVGTTCLQIDAVQVLLVLAQGVHMSLRTLQLLAALLYLRLQLLGALLPPLHALGREPCGQLLLQCLLMREEMALLLLAQSQITQRQQRDKLRIGQFQIRMNGGQFTKAINDLLGVVIGGMVVQHQLSENLVNAVELLQACCTVEQGEGVGPHFKKAVQLGQIRRLAGVHLQVITVLGQTCQGTRAAAVQLFQPEIQRLPLTLGKEPALLHIASGLAAAIKPEQGP